MPRTKKGVSTDTGRGADSENRRDVIVARSSSGKSKGRGASEVGRGAAGKDSKSKTKTRRNKPSKLKGGEEPQHAAAAATASSAGSSDEKERQVGGKVMEASKTIHDRDALRADVMTQVLYVTGAIPSVRARAIERTHAACEDKFKFLVSAKLTSSTYVHTYLADGDVSLLFFRKTSS